MPGPLPKPQMRDLYVKRIKIHLIGAGLFTSVGLLVYKYLYIERKKARRRRFYENYDADKQLQIMIDAGLMQGCPKPE